MSALERLPSTCPHCGACERAGHEGDQGRPGIISRFIGGRELLLAAAGLGILLGFGWVDDRSSCAALEQAQGDQLADRDRALERFVAGRCGPEGCAVEQLGLHGCQAKLRLREQRRDAYGERVGTFDSTLGLVYSPNRDSWQVDAVLAERQVLGLSPR